MKKLLNSFPLLIALALIVYACTTQQSTPSTGGAPVPALQALADDTQSQMKLGNPSNAGTSDRNNYLLEKPQFVIGYNCSKGIPNC